jgi:hypothetical protein
MRYFEIVKPPARHDPRKAAAGKPRSDTITTARERNMEAVQTQPTCGASNLLNQINRLSHRPHLSPRRSQ